MRQQPFSPRPPRKNLDFNRQGNAAWSAVTVKVQATRLSTNATHVRIHVYPAGWSPNGETTGRVWIDDVSFKSAGSNSNLVHGGDFQYSELDYVYAIVDFTDFDVAADYALNELGMVTTATRTNPMIGVTETAVWSIRRATGRAERR